MAEPSALLVHHHDLCDRLNARLPAGLEGAREVLEELRAHAETWEVADRMLIDGLMEEMDRGDELERLAGVRASVRADSATDTTTEAGA